MVSGLLELDEKGFVLTGPDLPRDGPPAPRLDARAGPVPLRDERPRDLRRRRRARRLGQARRGGRRRGLRHRRHGPPLPRDRLTAFDRLHASPRTRTGRIDGRSRIEIAARERLPDARARRGVPARGAARRRRRRKSRPARSSGGFSSASIFTVASAYSGLKVGQVMEAAIPISILAIGLARLYQRRSHLLENVIITTIGGVAGGVVAGAIFTLPALYSLNLHPHPVQTIFICLAGALPRDPLPHPAAPLLREGDARAVPVPGGDRDHGGPRHGREGRRAGEAPHPGDGHLGDLRLLRDDVQRLEGVRRLPVPARS